MKGPHWRLAAWMFVAWVAFGPRAVMAGEHETAFAVVGKMAVYEQTGAGEIGLKTDYQIDGREGAYVFFSSVDGRPGLPEPRLAWPQSAAFFSDYPEVAFVLYEDEEEFEWELRWNSNNLTALNAYFPTGSYRISIGDAEKDLQLSADPLPVPLPIAVTGNGDWRNGRYVMAEGNGLEISVTAPDWNDTAVRLKHLEIWGPEGEIVSESRINNADFLPGLAPPFTTDPTLSFSVAAEDLPWVPHGTYTVEFLYSTVEDVTTGDGIIFLSIVETSVRFDLIVARQWTYELWRDMMFSPEDAADPARSGPQVDFLGDGIPNLMKFAVNMRPWETIHPMLPQIRFENERLQAAFVKHRFADLHYVVEVSDDLVTWHSGEPHTRLEAVEEDFVFFDRVTYSDQNPDSSSPRFMRVRVEPVTP